MRARVRLRLRVREAVSSLQAVQRADVQGSDQPPVVAPHPILRVARGPHAIVER